MPQFFLDHIAGPRAGSEERFDADVVTVGRSDDSDLLFDGMGVSWNHAELRWRDGEWWLVDHGSTNGTYVNDERAHNARIGAGDVIKFGKKGPVVRLRVDAKPGSDAVPISSSATRRERKRRPRLPSEPEVQVYNLADLEDIDPNERHSHLPAAVTLRGGGAPVMVLLAMAVMVVISLCLVVVLYVAHQDQAGDAARLRAKLATAEGDLRKLEGEVTRRVATARENARLEALADAQRGEEALQRQIDTADRDRRAAEQSAASLRREVSRLQRAVEEGRRDLAEARSRVAEAARSTGLPPPSWQTIERRLSRSVVFIAVEMVGRKPDGTTVQFHTFGTGFFISSQGHIATNKHVIQPWKFRRMAEQLARERIDIVEGSYQVHAWQGGVRFVAPGGGLDLSTGFSTARNTLEIVRTAPDRWEDIHVDGDATRLLRVHHNNSNEDIALLRARTANVEPVPIGRSSEVRKLDEVLVLGFPAGPRIMEGGVAETAPTRGDVRKVDQAIYVSAPMLGGNSGGPLIDHYGRVIGISTRVIDGATLGACLKIEHAVQLLHGGAW